LQQQEEDAAAAAAAAIGYSRRMELQVVAGGCSRRRNLRIVP